MNKILTRLHFLQRVRMTYVLNDTFKLHQSAQKERAEGITSSDY